MRYSLAEYDALISPVLDAAGGRVLVEIGGEAGTGTAFLLGEAARRAGRLTVIEPRPDDNLLALISANPEARLERGRSLDVLLRLPPADAYFIDGDHNYYTVLNELRLIAADPDALPLIFVHDIGWPFGRRDGYYDPEDIPPAFRHDYDRSAGAVLDRADLVEGAGFGGGAIAMAKYEGGPGNGVLTALEDFLAETKGRFAHAEIPLFYGLGVVYPEAAPWAVGAAALLRPWHESPILERVERDRLRRLLSDLGAPGVTTPT